jgi:hypothetical protein
LRRIGFALALLAIAILAWRGLRDRPEAPSEQPAVTERTGSDPATSSAGQAGTDEDLEALLHGDPRLQRYLGQNARSGPFTADMSDPVTMLVGRLARSSSSAPVAQAKTELGQMGASAVPELRRFIEERFDRRELSPQVQNAYEALHQMEPGTDGVRQLLRDGIEHAETSVRSVAIRALAKHATVYEYDALFDLCPRVGPELQALLAVAMHTASPERLELDLADVLGEPGYEVARHTGASLIGTCAAASAGAYETLVREAPPAVLPFYAACRALHGDEEALELLRTLLVSENPTERSITANALSNAGLIGELVPLLKDPDPSLRIFALDKLAGDERSDERRARLSALLGDPSADVRRVALKTLVTWGDPAADEAALDGLKQTLGEFETALLALDGRWKTDAELARRALDILIALREERGHRAPGELARIENGIARVPLPDASRFLLQLGRAYPPRSYGARNEKLRNHRHFALKAGYAGRDVLREAWDRETDPLLRMDFAEAISFGATEEERAATREFLIGILRSDRVNPYEQLQAAMRIARLGPAAEVAPVLKRATINVSHPAVRRALQALLWDWYGE